MPDAEQSLEYQTAKNIGPVSMLRPENNIPDPDEGHFDYLAVSNQLKSFD